MPPLHRRRAAATLTPPRPPADQGAEPTSLDAVPPHVRLPPERRLDLLAVLAAAEPMQGLLDELRAAGFVVDVARDLASARTVFFGAGGHHCLLLGPDVPPSLAAAIVTSLRDVDPELPAVTFGPALCRQQAPSRTATLHFHPSSRAGAGALLRFLRTLPERG